MTEHNKKRYVYLDKFLNYQESITSKLKKMNTRVDILTYTTLGLIVAISMVLYKIFG